MLGSELFENCRRALVGCVHGDAPGLADQPDGCLASAREQVASLTETLWAAALPEDLLDVNVEIERLRSALGAMHATVAVEVEAPEAAKTHGVGLLR